MTGLKGRRGLAAWIIAAAAVISAPQVMARESTWTLEATYTADLIGPVAGDGPRRAVLLDNLDVVADLDLGRAMGWRGATLHGYLLSNQGGAPNDFAGTLQGVDNIEVGRQAVRLYELWVDAPVGEHLSILAGLYDLNSEFYATESAGLLIAPPFGIGSELASTGVNGPSIFPSTALALRVNLTGEAGYVRAAALNARASVPGDPDGVDTDFEDGALVIAEAGRRSGAGSLALGLWRYSSEQDDLRDLTPGGDPVRRTAQGAYLLAERVMLGDDDGRKVTGFVRLGVSDRRTSPFSGGWQAGVLVERVFAGRPDSALSVGLQQGLLSSRGQDLIAAGGVDPADAESGIEITYTDRLTDRVTIQPDLQVVFDAGGDRAAEPRVVFGVRLTIDLLP